MFLAALWQYRVTEAALCRRLRASSWGQRHLEFTKARKATMTSISALSSHHHRASPLQRLQDEVQAEVSSGAINSSDQSALSSALGDIDSALQSSSANDQSSGSKSSPDAFKSKIDDLIQQEVSAGKLTDQQATELQGIFKAAL